jgi:DNA-binding transcriptional regulator YdaS (Cro superfamily)
MAVQIEEATNGDVSRKDSRPDDWNAIWPEYQPKNTHESE